MRRLLAVAAGALALLVVPAVPASAAFSQAAWTSPAGVSRPTAGSDDWTAVVHERTSPQTVTLAGVFEHPDGVARVQLVLEHGEYAKPPCAPTGFGVESPGAASGPTTFSFDVLLPCNGRYVIRANAQSRPSLTGAYETAALRLVLTMAVPAVPVEDVRAVVTRREVPEVRLAWEPVPEADRDPDFAGYDIERAIGRGSYHVLASLPDPDASSYTDKAPDEAGGAHRYRVVSLRRAGADDEDGVVADPAAAPEADADVPPTVDPEEEEEDDADGGDAGGGAPEERTVTGPTSPQVVQRTYRTPSGPRTVTTVDTGFGQTLPFTPQAAEPPAEVAAPAPPAGDAAVVAQLEDDAGSTTTKQRLALVAGAGVMGIAALGVRTLLRRAASPFDILQ